MRTKFPVGALVAALALIVNPLANATPYASAVQNNAGVVSFTLNESADNVTVVFDGGASTQDLGVQSKGTHSFNMGTATSFEIVVKKTAADWELISNDTNRFMLFNSGRGVAVNMQPSSTYFGRIYVANSASGTASGRSVGDGIYILNADQTDALGRGDAVSTGGINFNVGAATPAANSPWHIEVGADNYLYIADFSTNSGTIYRTDPDVSGGSGQLVLANYGVTNQTVHTTIGSSPIVLGSLATGDMAVYAIDGQFPGGGGNFNRLYRWDVGAGPLPYSAPPTPLATPLINTVVNVTTDLDRAPDGKFFMMQNRSAGNESGIVVIDTDGTTILWRSLQESRVVLNDPTATDILKVSRAVKISPDNKKMAIIRDDLQTWVIPLVNGLPNLAQREVVQTYSGAPTTLGRDVCFDAAGNLYALSSGNQLLRIFSPGGRSTAKTRSDGTFDVEVIPMPSISVVATDAQGAEEGADPIVFMLSRNREIDHPLTVDYTLTGVATNGVDYDPVPLSVQFPAGESNVTVTVTPIDDSIAEVAETVTLNLVTNAAYSIRSPTNATATIADNEFPALRLTGGSKTNIYEPLSRDTLTLTVTKLGRADGDLFTAELISEGTATEGTDFTLSTNFFALPPGVVSQTVTITPLNDFDYEGTETIVIRIGPGSYDYNIDAQDTVTRWIRDDEQASAPVLFSEDFTADPSPNWLTRFGANNGIYDATVDWHYDYSQAGVGPAPNTSDGSTLGLYAAVNKTNGAAGSTGGSAGINFYPIGQSFSGDYALRFDMYLSFGTANTTEHALLGINHSGTHTNRATQSSDPDNTTAGGDGFWVGIVTDASNLEDYSGYTYPTPTSLPTIVVRRAASTLTSLITSPPYAFAGSPGSSTNGRAWAEVELSQVSNLISLKVNDILIWEYQNTNSFTSGNIMLGMNDQFDSIGPAQQFVVFDNVRVVNLSTAVRITHVEFVGNNQVQIDFTSPTGGDASAYTLRTKGSLAAANWAPDGSAQISSLGGTEYRALANRTPGERYYSVSKP
ncbi:MAG TPA: Calx-beta domain-containing protein [Candidatus Binatia bacterium]|nr:Calx-beta domain-containing protein [Candidatus Binatia bacterium]